LTFIIFLVPLGGPGRQCKPWALGYLQDTASGTSPAIVALAVVFVFAATVFFPVLFGLFAYSAFLAAAFLAASTVNSWPDTGPALRDGC
jgi:hypothetical protein